LVCQSTSICVGHTPARWLASMWRTCGGSAVSALACRVNQAEQELLDSVDGYDSLVSPDHSLSTRTCRKRREKPAVGIVPLKG
jgi:hypothetical protein